MSGRLLAFGALVAAAVIVAVLLMGGTSYTINARYVDAGQVVKGGLVEVGGRTIGKIAKIEITESGEANVELRISDAEYSPLHRGTTARIRTVGLSGVANRFIEITPGPDDAEKIPDNGVLSVAETYPIVDLDVLFNSLDGPTRDRLQRIIQNGSQLFDGVTNQANTAFSYLAPALSESEQLTEELTRDRLAVEKLLTTGATTATALASRRDDISQGIAATATTLKAVASEREALADSFARAPALLERPKGILGGLETTLNQVRPALREARPVTPRLAVVLRKLVPTARETVPVLAQTRSLLPQLTRDLNALPGLARNAVPALNSTTTSLISGEPVIDGLRPYIPDLVNGFFNGLGGRTAGYYDANGHYGRIALQGGSATLTGLLGGVLQNLVDLDAGGLSTGNVARCPGGAAGPADDGSSPFVDKPSICDPSHDQTQ
jgi:phospholipid/cholesterol/gamma-HCH transport system substrate-binding protein